MKLKFLRAVMYLNIVFFFSDFGLINMTWLSTASNGKGIFCLNTSIVLPHPVPLSIQVLQLTMSE